ncbi:PHP domain-containing protein [Paenibacillus sp. F411]|uniref:PHP domain-containing protein n=1 Tax=Paenibacillus sp. F411 TaxID=2820239 RepID=UPI001AAF2AF3|nr:PHP domain-containing protein [Paenibacillus sp. F411]MBO2944959.1 PHP domain-containing protein [Paenibacillus sp. F411]
MQHHDRQGACDLHSHTTASDGMNSPSEQVSLARKKGLAAVAITDHDTVAGVQEALEAAPTGILVVPGVEISTQAGGKDIHVLGYYINHRDELLGERLRRLRDTREARNHMIIRRLNSLGMSITMEEVISGLGRELKPDESVGRPHIADVLVAKGYAQDLRDAFDRYLAQGKPGYAPQPRITPAEACAWITEAGGAAVLAHPGLYGEDALVQALLAEGGFDGIEVYHADHGAQEEERYRRMGEERGLILTGGSDYHGERQGIVFHGDLGSKTVPVSVLNQLQAVCRRGGASFQ